MRIFLLLLSFLVLFCASSCSEKTDVTPSKKTGALISYVNPFIGTGGHGHTYPGATLPYGMMQLSPDTRLDGWDGCSGYHYTRGGPWIENMDTSNIKRLSHYEEIKTRRDNLNNLKRG